MPNDDFLHRWHKARQERQEQNDALLKGNGNLRSDKLLPKGPDQKDHKPH